MTKLSNYDGRFVVQLLDVRRAALLEMMQRLSEQSRGERAAELRRLDAALIKAELPQITNPEMAESIDVSKGRYGSLQAVVKPFVATRY